LRMMGVRGINQRLRKFKRAEEAQIGGKLTATQAKKTKLSVQNVEKAKMVERIKSKNAA
jgi:hypothetical protein